MERGRTYHLEYLALTSFPEGDLLRATVTGTSAAWTLRSTSSQFVVADPSQDAILRHLDAIPYRKPVIRWFMNHLHSSKSTAQLRRHLLDGTAIQVSDGSYFLDYQVGACAWILATPDGEEWIEGGGLVPGSPEDQSAYRSELAGQVGAVSFVDSIDLAVQEGTQLTTYCDRISALKQVGKHPDTISCKTKHVNLVSILTKFWYGFKFRPLAEHVYGHRDESSHNPTIPEQLNCRMDQLAKWITLRFIEGPDVQSSSMLVPKVLTLSNAWGS